MLALKHKEAEQREPLIREKSTFANRRKIGSAIYQSLNFFGHYITWSQIVSS